MFLILNWERFGQMVKPQNFKIDIPIGISVSFTPHNNLRSQQPNRTSLLLCSNINIEDTNWIVLYCVQRKSISVLIISVLLLDLFRKKNQEKEE